MKKPLTWAFAAFTATSAGTAQAQETTHQQPARVQLAAGPTGAMAGLGLAPRIGQERVYRVKYAGTAEVSYGVLASSFTRSLGVASTDSGAVQRIRYDIGAEVHWRTLSTTERGQVAAVRLRDVDYRVDGGKDERGELFETPFLVHLGPAGAITQVAFPAHFPNELQRAMRSVIMPLQVVLGPSGESSWNTVESDVETTYRAEYAIRGIDRARGVASVEKKKTAIVDHELARSGVELPGALKASVRRSEASLQWDLKSGSLLSASGREQVALNAGSVRLSSHDSSFSAERLDVPAAQLPQTLEEAQAGLADPGFARASTYAVDRQLRPQLEGLDAKGALAAYTLAVRQSAGGAAHFLEQYVRFAPAAASEIARALDALPETTEERVIGFAWAALASAGHVEAQRAIVASLDGARVKPRTQEKALTAMMELKFPEPFAVQAVWQLRSSMPAVSPEAEVLQSMATNVFGALGDAAKGNPEVTREVVRTLGAHLAGSRDLRQQQQALDALSNVGDLARVLPVVEPYFQASDEGIRAKAFETFRRMGGDEAFSAFASRFAAERSPLVRAEAVRTALFMPQSPARSAWARELVRSGGVRDPDTLSRLVTILGREVKEQPENESLLRELLKTERDRMVRKTIYGFVAPVGGAR